MLSVGKLTVFNRFLEIFALPAILKRKKNPIAIKLKGGKGLNGPAIFFATFLTGYT